MTVWQDVIEDQNTHLFDGEPLKQSKLKAAKHLQKTSIPLPIMAIQIRVWFVKDCPHFCGCLEVTCSSAVCLFSESKAPFL